MTQTSTPAPATTAVRADALRVGMVDGYTGSRITHVGTFVMRGTKTTYATWTTEDGARYDTVAYNSTLIVAEEEAAPAEDARTGELVENSPARPARVCRFVPAWALVVLVATLVSVAVNAGPGVAALIDYATHAHTATLAPLAAPGDGQGALCDTDARCGALAAREDQRAGRVPAVAFGPAPDGGVAVSCPDGWEVDGSSVLDARCVPSTALLDA